MPTERDLKQFFDDYAESTDVNAVTHTVQVTSFGGAGTTALCGHLDRCGVDIQSGPGHWPFKHRRTPPAATATPPGFRAIYVVGDPRDAVISLFRRNYQIGHFRAMNEREPVADELARLDSLDSFVSSRTDVFAMAEHLDAWLTPGRGYPVMTVKHDSLADSWPTIAEFVGVDADVLSFPRRDRRSDWRSQPEPVRVALNEIFGDLAARIEALPPTSIVE